MKIIQHARIETTTHFAREFSRPRKPGSPCGPGGWSFPCDQDGNIDMDSLHPLALENLTGCLAGNVRGDDVIDKGIRSWTENFRFSAVGLCDCCKSEVFLSNFTNTCDCGAEYNSCGQRLASRSQWGEETGEHWTDCV